MRQCGKCNLCCVYFSINDPANETTGFKGLNKAVNVVCPHSTENGCDIYDKKGPVCNNYRCLWKQGFLPDWLKPDDIQIVFDRVEKINNMIYMVGRVTEFTQAKEDIAERICRELRIPVILTITIKKHVDRKVVFDPNCKCDNCKAGVQKMQKRLGEMLPKPTPR